MKKIFFIAVMTALLNTGFILNTAIADNGAQPSVSVTQEKTVILDIPGMYCPTCPFTVRKSLEKVDGVKNVKTSSEAKTAIVTYDSSKLTVNDLIKATTDVGYPSTKRGGNND